MRLKTINFASRVELGLELEKCIPLFVTLFATNVEPTINQNKLSLKKEINDG